MRELPEKCNDEIAEFLSDLGYGFSVGERIANGQQKWKRLRKLLVKQQKVAALAK